MNTNRIFGAICGLLLLLALSACSSPKFPYGTYNTTEGGIPGGGMKFNSDGTYVATANGGMIFTKGTFSVKGNMLTFLTDMQCFNQGVNATYTWTYSNETLILKDTGNDSCVQRKSDIDSSTYHLQK
jgi:hypothetical protein